LLQEEEATSFTGLHGWKRFLKWLIREVDMKGKATNSVLVIYQDDQAREEAVKFCDDLIERFWADYEFDVNWWSFDLLQEARMARDAGTRATEANLIIFAARPDGEIAPHVKEWIESWATARGDREGALVGLLDSGDALAGDRAQHFVYLRNVAHRAGMDYLTQVPRALSGVPDSIESYTERADQVTSVLDEILHHKASPPRL
jgi:hypothetical protein